MERNMCYWGNVITGNQEAHCQVGWLAACLAKLGESEPLQQICLNELRKGRATLIWRLCLEREAPKTSSTKVNAWGCGSQAGILPGSTEVVDSLSRSMSFERAQALGVRQFAQRTDIAFTVLRTTEEGLLKM